MTDDMLGPSFSGPIESVISKFTCISGRMMLTNTGWCGFPMLSRICMLSCFSPSPILHLKGRTYGEGEYPSKLP